MHYIGIDLAWTVSGFTGVCILSKNGTVRFLDVWTYTDEALLDIIESYREEELIIGIDAPLIVKNKRGTRKAEKLLFQSNVSNYPFGALTILTINRDFILRRYGMIRGEELYRKLSKNGLKFLYTAKKNKSGVLEVFPKLIITAFFPGFLSCETKIKRGRKEEAEYALRKFSDQLVFGTSVRNLRDYINLQRLKGLTRKDIKLFGDMIDAFLISYALFAVNTGKAEELVFGDKKEGFIWTPVEAKR